MENIYKDKLIVEGLNFETGEFETVLEIDFHIKTQEEVDQENVDKLKKLIIKHIINNGIEKLFKTPPIMFPNWLEDLLERESPTLSENNDKESSDGEDESDEGT